MSIIASIREKIRQEVKSSLFRAQKAGRIVFQEMPEFVVEVPRDKSHGDFAVNAAMLLTKEAKMAPRAIAQIIVEFLRDEDGWFEKVEVAGPGFINFFLNTSWVYGVLPMVIKQDDKYGYSDFGSGRKVQVEFVSANPTGLLHMGNARGAALGDTLSNILEAAGYEVTREFYINDAGNQIENFGKSLEARYLQLLGVDAPFPEEGYHGEDIIETVKNIAAEIKDKYLDLDPALRREFLIKKALEEKINSIKNDLANFGVEYDVWFSEQTLHDSGAISRTVEELKEKGYIYEKGGALWFKSTLFGDEKDEVVVRSNGVPTYFAADIAYHKNKFERGFDRVIDIWGADHHGHVSRMKGAMKALGYNPDNLQVILMQLVRLYRGGEIVRMSKRSGQYITLSELVEEVGKDAARYYFVMRSPDSHLDFDLDLAKEESAENPVYYVQYAHARINSILKAFAGQMPGVDEVNFNLLTEPYEIELIRKIADLPEEITGAAVNMEPHRMTRYAHELASLFHSFYNSCRVLTDDEELKKARLLLVDAVRITLRNVLGLIGVSAPVRM
ncbi:MAG: arginine--tRNA ligase [Peptococcaceae bacterium]|jgi:arginyl-tRNA synthetase|nr:arginine--tRNA ligase [Peptococcaceae bacterium]MDH7523744.1 arginine--tRNA ligase [Peptococcaceae bacterium]